MTALTILQSKISRTKKRLSNNVWYLPIIVLALMLLMTFLSTALRGISMPGSFGIVEAEFPVVSDDQSLTPTESWTAPRSTIDNTAALVILTRDRFYFGNLQSFGKDLSAVHNKFQIPHIDGAPDLPRLVLDLSKWQSEAKASRALIFVPTEDIPMPIVIQCFAALKSSGLFDNVILGGGLL
ncbi:MAG: hypothetical protein EOP07_17150 [Proteobacteria bacterium]|nr:MAG: hypothetical protein EOP07_17150 [Pseudomonadota bacterium]